MINKFSVKRLMSGMALFVFANLAFVIPAFGALPEFESGEVVSFADLAGARPYPELRATESGGILEQIWNWILKQMESYIRYDVELIKVNYQTTTADGQTIPVTGLIVMPVSDNHTNALPLMAFQHPTQVERRYSPSVYTNAADIFSDPQFSAPLAFLVGMSGYVVVLADYPGLGDNTNAHPYCQLSLANSVVDIMRAGLNLLPHDERYPEWNNKLYLMGFSEGGYATMITARRLQLQPTNGLIVSATAALDGPYSLSDTMRDVMLNAGTNYTAPYFLPYVINGYDSVYAADHPEYNFTNAVLNSVPADPDFAANLRRMVMDGTNTAGEINQQMYKVDPYTGPASILTGAFRALLADINSVVCGILRDNNAYNGWAPDAPMMIAHNYYDDYVPYGNAAKAYNAFALAGATNLMYTTYGMGLDGVLIELLKSVAGSIHTASAPFAYLKGFQWIDRYSYPDRAGSGAVWGDLDGDGRTDPALYNAGNGTFSALLSDNGYAGVSAALGGAGCMARLADYDGDGRADPTAYDPATGDWRIMSSLFLYQTVPLNLGVTGDYAVPLDYNGDGLADPAVFESTLGIWTSWSVWDGVYTITQLGGAGMLPVPADYDGDGNADRAALVQLTGSWLMELSGSDRQTVFSLGYFGCLPAVGDYDGDGMDDPGVFWPDTGGWLVRLSSTGQNVTMNNFGEPGFAPVTGDYDGDGKADPVIYSESAGEWRARLSGAGYSEVRLAFGGAGWQPAR